MWKQLYTTLHIIGLNIDNKQIKFSVCHAAVPKVLFWETALLLAPFKFSLVMCVEMVDLILVSPRRNTFWEVFCLQLWMLSKIDLAVDNTIQGFTDVIYVHDSDQKLLYGLYFCKIDHIGYIGGILRTIYAKKSVYRCHCIGKVDTFLSEVGNLFFNVDKHL